MAKHVVIDTNILHRMIEALGNVLDPDEICRELLDEKTFCRCELEAYVIIAKASFNELRKHINPEIVNYVEDCFTIRARRRAIGIAKKMHSVALVTYKGVLQKVKKVLKGSLKHIEREYDDVVKNLEDEADQVIVGISLLKAYECSESENCIIYLLTTDKKLFSIVNSLLYKVGLANYLIVPSKVFDADSINTCIYNECSVECLLREN